MKNEVLYKTLLLFYRPNFFESDEHLVVNVT